MKKIILIATCLLMAFGVFGETSKEKPSPFLVVAPNLLGPIVGFYSGTINIRMTNDVTLDSDFFYWNVRNIPLIGDSIDRDFQFWTAGIKSGPTFYLNKAFHGLYVGAFGKLNYFYIGEDSDNVSAGSFGLGVKGGWTGTWSWFSLSVGAGYEYSKAFADITVDSSNQYLGMVEGGSPVFIIQMGIAIY